MRVLPQLVKNNRAWSEAMKRVEPEYFSKLAEQQNPEFLWIGCSDSRVPANQIVGLEPGEVFVHRNIANVVNHSDFNCLSVIEYAVAVLKVTNIIVCGHYGCGGVAAASETHHLGLIDNWLRHIRDVRQNHEQELIAIEPIENRLDRLCELNVIEQTRHVCQTTIVQQAWEDGSQLAVHGWIYRLRDGLLQDLDVTVTGPEELTDAYRVSSSGQEA
jgi:carbonic anhydrase